MSARRLSHRTPEERVFTGRSVPAPQTTPETRSPTYTSLVALDIVGFCAPPRDEEIQCHLRAMMYRIVEQTFALTWLPYKACYQEDRGDGVLLVMPPEVPPYLLLDPLAFHLDAALRRGNRLFSAAAQMRLRMAVHTGFVHRDSFGVVGHAVNHLFRLLNSAALRESIEESGTDLAVLVSDRMFGDVNGAHGCLDAARYTPVHVVCKETESRAWLWRSPYSPPAATRVQAVGSPGVAEKS